LSLRDAVAGAVARAAAQGPLIPRNADEDEPSPEGPQASEDAERWLAGPDASWKEVDPSLPVAPVDTEQTQDTEGDVAGSGTAPAADPYEEFTRLAGEYASAGSAPPLHAGHTAVWPASTTPTGEEAPDAEEAGAPLTDASDAQGPVEVQDIVVDIAISDDSAVGAEALEVVAREAAALEMVTRETVVLQAVVLEEEAVLEEAVLEEAVLEEAVLDEAAHEEEHPGEAVRDEPSAEVEPEDAAPGTTMPDDTTPDAPTTEEPIPEAEIPEDATPEDATGEDATTAADSDEAAQEDATPEQVTQEDAAWPFGERRSAARQARKPLPAALQEAVAAGVAQDLAQSTSQSEGGHASVPADGPRAKADGPGAATGKRLDAQTPGLLRRYGSAIAIVVLFVAAGGVAAGIAAFRGPVNPTGPSTAARDQAAANAAVLTSADFPSGWHVSPASSPVGAYGLGSQLVTPSVVQTWRASHPNCSAELNDVSEAMTPAFGNVTAVAYTQAATTNPLGGPWQIADAVAFHTSATDVGSAMAAMRSLLDQPKSQQCVAQFWSAALRPQFPKGSSVTMRVEPLAIRPLPGRPSGWAMKMTGTAVVRHERVPLRFEITSLAAGRAEVFLVVSSQAAALPANLAARLLRTLAVRAKRLALPGA
jgi:hypothetical protein